MDNLKQFCLERLKLSEKQFKELSEDQLHAVQRLTDYQFWILSKEQQKALENLAKNLGGIKLNFNRN